ncbi:MAG: hypothetical protein DYG89_52085 [Caldilinea sp. CFX5]|nr:hypothetical protein [Caldilinea sp. CFX5]
MSSQLLHGVLRRSKLLRGATGVKSRGFVRWFGKGAIALLLVLFIGALHETIALAASGNRPMRQSHATDFYPLATIQGDFVALRSGPGQDYPVVSQVANNSQFTVGGYSIDGAWVQLCCVNGTVGWVETTQVAIVRGVAVTPVVDPTPTPTPTPLPTPTPTLFYYWKTSYFANMALAGEPAYVEDLMTLNLDWRDGAPHPLLPADAFSVRFERTLDLPSGYYRFQIQADDGVRLFINDLLVLNEWHGATGTTYMIEQLLTGVTTFRLEYFEGNGNAFLRFTNEVINTDQAWEAAYFRGAALNTAPWLTQAEPAIGGYPLARRQPLGVVADPANWSARWWGRFPFTYGNYVFHARAQGGVRVYLNEYLVLDGWTSGSKEISNTFWGVGGETHTITVEYYSDANASGVQVWWERQ